MALTINAEEMARKSGFPIEKLQSAINDVDAVEATMRDTGCDEEAAILSVMMAQGVRGRE